MFAVEPTDVGMNVLRQAYGSFPTGVIAICALHDGEPTGMAVSSFTSVSLQPALVSVCMQDTSATWPKLRQHRRLGVSVLSEEHDQACRALSSKDGDRFANLDWRIDGDAVFVQGATAWFDCSIHEEVPAGDHTIALLRIHRLSVAEGAAPLVFHHSRFCRLEDHPDLVSTP